MPTLKLDANAKLNITRRKRAGGQPKLAAVEVSDYGGVHAQIHIVEDIKKFGAELQLRPLRYKPRYVRPLDRGEIGIDVTGTDEGVPAQGS